MGSDVVGAGAGCCTDKACTSSTCMNLPEGQSCGGCAHFKRCVALFQCAPDNTTCDWFPRRFRVSLATTPPAPAVTP